MLWARDRHTAVASVDLLALEHSEIQTDDDDDNLAQLHNYGSALLGPLSTVVYPDKGIAGTNHVLPTTDSARHSVGLSASPFLEPFTWQRVTREATPALASAMEKMTAHEDTAAHGATATMGLAAYKA